MKRRTVIKASLVVVFSICIVLVAIIFILNSVVSRRIRKQFNDLSPAIHVKSSAVKSSIFGSMLTLDSLEINFTPDPGRNNHRHVLSFKKASLYGIHFVTLLANRKLVAKSLVLDQGMIRLDRSLLNNEDSIQQKILSEIKWPMKNLAVENVQLRNCTFFFEDSDQPIAKGDATLKGVDINKIGERPKIFESEVHLSAINYPFSDYRIAIRTLDFSSSRKLLTMHSLQLHSAEGKSQSINIGSLKIAGMDVMDLVDKQTLKAEKIVLRDGVITITDQTLKNVSIFRLNKIHADILDFNHLVVSYRNSKSSVHLHANIQVQKFSANRGIRKNDFHFGSIKATLSDLEYSDRNYHAAEIKKIEVDTRKEVITAEQVRIMPTLGKYQLARRLGHQVDWLAANISKIEMIKPDFEKLVNKKVFAREIIVSESKAYVFRDRRLPRPQKALPLPVEYLKTAPFEIRVSKFIVASSAVEYEEYPRSGFGQTGALKILNAAISVSPLINRPRDADPEYMTMKAVGSIMGSGTVHGTILMPLSKNKPYYMKGAIEKLELTRLNSSSENLGKIRIKSGFLDYLSFDFTMTKERSTGKIVGAYHRLIIQQLKKHTDEKNVADFASFMLRHVIIPLNKDVSVPERKRTGLVNYTRDPTRFVSYYFLQSLLMGVKKSFALGFLLPK